MRALIVGLALLAGCSTTPMTPEERAQNDRLIEALSILKNQVDMRRQPVMAPPPPQVAAPTFVPIPQSRPAPTQVPTVWLLIREFPINQSKVCVYSNGIEERSVVVPVYSICDRAK